MARVLFLAILAISGLFLDAWMVMVIIGVVHHEILETVRPIGYEVALGIATLMFLYVLLRGFYKGLGEAVVD